MPQQQAPWLEGKYGWNFGESGWNSGMDQNLLKFSFMFDGNVDGVVATLPPVTNGAAYFNTADNRFYFGVDNIWYSSPCPKFFIFKIKSNGDFWQFDGTSASKIDKPSEVDARLTSLELTVSSLGSAAFEDSSAFATQTELDIVEANAQAYTDALRQDLQQPVGGSLVGFIQAGTGAEATSVLQKCRQSISVLDFIPPSEHAGIVEGSSTFDCGPGIQAAIDYARDSGKHRVYVPAGRYLTGQTIRVYALTQLVGAGSNVTFIKAKDGSNIGVLETDGFEDLTGTTTKFVTDPGMTWGFSIKGLTIDGNRQNNYGGVSGTRFGGVASSVWDGFGIRLYGRRYVIEDVKVQYCAGIGFYSECGNPSTPSPSDWYYNALNNQQGHIKDFVISQCSYEGFVFLGPGDIRIEDVTSELCFYPDETEYGNPRPSLMFPTESIAGMVFWSKMIPNTAVGGCEIGFIHSHTHKNGYGIRFGSEGNLMTRIRGENITSEGNLGGIKIQGRCTGQLNKVNIRNQNYGDGSLPDLDYANQDNEAFVISEYENRASTGNAGSVRLMIRSDGLQIGTVTILGGTPGHGVVLSDNVNFVQIDQLNCRNLRGTAYDGNASRALWTKSSAAFNYIGKVVLLDNDVGWYNESNGENVIAQGVISANTASYPSALPVVFAVTPIPAVLRKCQFITRDGVSSKHPLFVGSSAINPTITTEQTITFTHNMWRTPSLSEVSLSYTTDGTTRPTLQYMEVVSTSSTTIVARIKFSAAGNGTTASAIFAKV